MTEALMVLLALRVDVDTQLTVDDYDSGLCESSTSDEVVSVIRKECGLITEELKDVKQRDFQSMISAVTSIQQVIYVLCRLRDKKTHQYSD